MTSTTYGWIIYQPLPYADFRWIDDIDNFDIMNVALNSPISYVLEVDLEYPQHVHAHSDLPFCPTRKKPPDKRKKKLLATMIKSVTSYIIAICSCCIHHNLCITKIHRIL